METNKISKFLIDTLDAELGINKLDRQSIIARSVLSTEDMSDSDNVTATGYKADLDEMVENAIQQLTSQPELGISREDFTSAQIKAAKFAAAMSMDPKLAMQSLSALRPMADGISVETQKLGANDIVDASTISTEAYDGQNPASVLHFSVSQQLMSAKQDEFGEAFFPTIVIDPMSSGAVISAEFISLYNEVRRDVNGSSNVSKFGNSPIIKNIFNNEVFNTSKNKLVPVVRTENQAYFDTSLQYVDTSAGEAITTAPLLFGKELDLLAISQTEAMLTRGIMDETDALDTRVLLDNLYFKLEGVDNENDPVTEKIKFNVNSLPGSNFTYNAQDRMKSMVLTFKTSTFTINTSTTTTSNGSASVILAGLAPSHTVKFKMTVSGNLDLQFGNVTVFANQLEIVEIRDAAGNVLPTTDSTYVAIFTALNTNITFSGYTLEAYRTNSNHRTRGNLITSDRYRLAYAVNLRTGVTILSPVNNAMGDDNDASKISNSIMFTGLRTSTAAVNTLVNFGKMLQNITTNGAISDDTILGAGSYYVNAYAATETINISNKVDSLTSAERLADIKAVLNNAIENMVLNSAVQSNYYAAHQLIKNGGKIDVIIGTDPVIATYLTRGEGIDLGDKYVPHVVATQNDLIKGKIYITFGVYGGDRNASMDPLNFGQCLWAPTITTNLVRTYNGATSKELNTIPRFLHVPNLPILNVIEVTGISDALGKVTVNMKSL